MVLCFYSHAESEATRLLAEFDTEPRHWRQSHGLLPAPWIPFEVFRLASTPGQTSAYLCRTTLYSKLSGGGRTCRNVRGATLRLRAADVVCRGCGNLLGAP